MCGDLKSTIPWFVACVLVVWGHSRVCGPQEPATMYIHWCEPKLHASRVIPGLLEAYVLIDAFQVLIEAFQVWIKAFSNSD